MTIEHDLLAAVVADPTDDAARLVYADYLMERGDPRGERIRLHGALADRSTAALRHPARSAMMERFRALQRAHTSTVGAMSGLHCVVRRDLVDEVTLALGTLRQRAKRLFAEHPITRLVIKLHDDTDLGALDIVAPLVPPTVTSIVLAGRRTRRDGPIGGLATCAFAGQGAALFAGRDVTLSRFVLAAADPSALLRSLAGACCFTG